MRYITIATHGIVKNRKSRAKALNFLSGFQECDRIHGLRDAQYTTAFKANTSLTFTSGSQGFSERTPELD